VRLFYSHMKFILGLKKEMTQIFDEKNRSIPVTKIEAGPCFISQIKDIEKDGYRAIQIAYKNKKKGSKAQKGQFKAIEGADFFQYLREFRIPESDATLEKIKAGQEVKVNLFAKGEKVTVSSTSKGQGFQGVVKRHGFKGGPASHGHKDQLRMPGSIGATGPAHVFKGTKMPGRMGGNGVTLNNLEIIAVKPEENVIFIKGAVPGAQNSLVLISNTAEFEISKVEEKKPEEKKEEKPKEEKKETKKEDKVKAEPKPAEKKKEAAKEEPKAKAEKPKKEPEVKTEESKKDETKEKNPGS